MAVNDQKFRKVTQAFSASINKIFSPQRR